MNETGKGQFFSEDTIKIQQNKKRAPNLSIVYLDFLGLVFVVFKPENHSLMLYLIQHSFLKQIWPLRVQYAFFSVFL